MNVTARARELHTKWREAYRRMERRGTDLDAFDEQATHDALVDFVEANGLVDTEYDPRAV